jgi:hypothetical protein
MSPSFLTTVLSFYSELAVQQPVYVVPGNTGVIKIDQAADNSDCPPPCSPPFNFSR